MARTRVDIWNATDAEGDWPAVLEAYERAIGTMRGLDPPNGPPTDPIGWQFQAAIHGRVRRQRRPRHGSPFWCNCQHGSWFFLPWHRMYLAAFEKIIQFHLEDETWALPYWYAIDPDAPKKAALPPAFLDLTLNDNNLQTDERSQIAKAGQPFYGDIDPVQVGETVLQTLRAFRYSTPSGAATFGGGERADLSFDGGERGLLENMPHGAVHSLVGNDFDEFGQLLDPGGWGRSSPPALDPIFWCHHANIDRLWEVWLRADAGPREPDRGLGVPRHHVHLPGSRGRRGDLARRRRARHRVPRLRLREPRGARRHSLPEPERRADQGDRPRRRRRCHPRCSEPPATCPWPAQSRSRSRWSGRRAGAISTPARRRAPTCASRASPAPAPRRCTASTSTCPRAPTRTTTRSCARDRSRRSAWPRPRRPTTSTPARA